MISVAVQGARCVSTAQVARCTICSTHQQAALEIALHPSEGHPIYSSSWHATVLRTKGHRTQPAGRQPRCSMGQAGSVRLQEGPAPEVCVVGVLVVAGALPGVHSGAQEDDHQGEGVQQQNAVRLQ